MARGPWSQSTKDVLTRRVIALLARGMTIPEIMLEVSQETRPDANGIERVNRSYLENPRTGKPYTIDTLYKIERAQREQWEAQNAEEFASMKAEALNVALEARRAAWARSDLRAVLVANDQVLKIIQGYKPIRVDNRNLDVDYASLTNDQLIALRDGADLDTVLGMEAELRRRAMIPTTARARAALELRRRQGDPELFRPSRKAWTEFTTRYWNRPDLFAVECVAWREKEKGIAEYQREILGLIADADRVAVRGPRGMGKTSTLAIMVLWYALTRRGTDWKIITSASYWRQLQLYLWPEIHKWARRLKWAQWAPENGVYGVPRREFKKQEFSAMRIRVYGGEAFAVATNRADSIEGAHADYVLCLFDESKIIPVEIWDSVEGVFSSCIEGKWFAGSTPGPPAGRFYEIFKGRSGLEDWVTRVVTVEEAVAAGRISQAWVDGRKRLWGEDSAFYRQQVLAEFAAEIGNAMIPLSWVEIAQELHFEWEEGGRRQPNGQPSFCTAIGVDVGGGRLSGDLTPIAMVYDAHIVGEIQVIEAVPDPEQATQFIGGRLMDLMAKHTRADLFIDSGGIGAGLYHHMKGSIYGPRVFPFNASFGTTLTDESGLHSYINWRAAAWYLMRDAMQPMTGLGIAIPESTQLSDELTTMNPLPTNARGQMRVEGQGRHQRENRRVNRPGRRMFTRLDGARLDQQHLERRHRAARTT